MTVLATALRFPECARWSQGELWFVDTPYLSVLTSAGDVRRHARIPSGLVLGLAFTRSGNALVGDSIGRRIYSVSPAGTVDLLADLSGHFNDPTNEMIVTPDDAVLVGSLGFDVLGGGTPRTSRLARIDPAGKVHSVGPELLFPNGMRHSRPGEIVVAESLAQRLTRLSVVDGADLVEVGQVDLSRCDATHPDGICPGLEDEFWFADPRAGLVIRVAADGRQIQALTVPFKHPTSCEIGGADGYFLYITGTDRMPGADLALRTEAAIAGISLRSGSNGS